MWMTISIYLANQSVLDSFKFSANQYLKFFGNCLTCYEQNVKFYQNLVSNLTFCLQLANVCEMSSVWLNTVVGVGTVCACINSST